jgi:hypothetical protein
VTPPTHGREQKMAPEPLGETGVDSVTPLEVHGTTWRRALWLTLLLRIVYSVLGAFIGQIQPIDWRLIHSNALTERLPQPDHSLHYLFVGVWERFDTLWYLHIAAHGYDRPDAVVFFPGYPILIRVLSVLMPPIVAALLISTLGAFFLFWGLQELLLKDHPPDLVVRSLFACAAWPASFIFFAGYPESLFLAIVIWTICMACQDRWPVAIALGLAATVTKGVGIVVTVPLLVLALRHRKVMVLPVLLIPLGSIGFLEYLRWTGQPTLASAYAEYWRTTVAPPWTTLWSSVQILTQTHSVILVLNLICLVCVSVLAVLSRVRIEYLLYSAAAIAVFLCKETNPPLQSLLRYLLIVFPAFLGFARCFQSPNFKPRFGMVCASLFVINLGLLWLFLGWSLVL